MPPHFNHFPHMHSSDILTSNAKISKRADLAGVKARNLARIQLQGFPVPEFIVISTRAYLHRRQLTAYKPALIEKLAAACQAKGIALFGESIVARSSAPFEDLDRFSLAGQLDSVLDINSADELLAGIEKVWASLQAERLQHYFKQARLAEAKKTIAVILQKQINSQISGVMFTSHPLSRDQHMLIELQEGGCEQIVAGQVAPHQVLVSKEDARIIQSDSPSQVIESFIPAKIPQLIEMGLALEKLFKMPVDIEWGCRNDKLWIFQVRPITVFWANSRIVTDSNDEQWTDYFFAERFDRAVSPLAWSFLNPIISKNAFKQPLWFLGRDDLLKSRSLTRCFQGIPHTHLQVFHQLYSVLPMRLISEDKKNALMLDQRQGKWWVQALRAVPYLLTRAMMFDLQWLPWVNLRAWRRFSLKTIMALGQLRKQLEVGAETEWLAVFKETRTLSEHFLAIHRWSITFADIFNGLLSIFLKTVTGQLHRPEELLAGLPGNATVEANLALLSCDRNDPKQKQRFLDRFGHRGSSLDFAFPCWRDNPDMLFDSHRIHGDQLKKMTTIIAENNRRRNEAQVDLEKAIQTAPSYKRIIRRLLLNPLLETARKFFTLRENQRDLWQRILYITRLTVLLIADSLVEQRLLRHRDDVFLLTERELAAIVSGEKSALTKIENRKHQRANKPTVPMNNQAAGRTSEPFWMGIGVSEGTATGRVRVVKNLEQAMTAQPGDILVAPSADPAWTTIFSQLSGLILETGGVLSHAAIVAREFRLPAIANIRGATALFKTNDLITMDGRSGIVKLNQREHID